MDKVFRRKSRSRSQDNASSDREEEIERERGRESGDERDMEVTEDIGDVQGPDHTLDTTSFDVTNNHPLGRLLLNNLLDTSNLARKTNTKESENNVKELCDMFCAHLNLTDKLLEEKIKKNNEQFERELLDKEVDSHKINASIMPPSNWGVHPTLEGNAQRQTSASKAFPGIGKFRGFPREGYMNVVEFLTHLKTAQEQCKLSKKEFIEKMIIASTGEAHELLSYSRDQNETLEDMYHQLLMRFDDRITVDEAKAKLQAFRATKNMNLAKIESQIMILAGRACAQYPVGTSRQAYYNMEACQALIRALPPASNITASTVYNNITARLGEAPSYTYFTRALNTHRTVIDQDVRHSGAEPVRFGKFNAKKAKATPRIYANKRPNFNAYSVTMSSTGAEAVSQTPPKPRVITASRRGGAAYKPAYPTYQNRYRTNFTPNARGSVNYRNGVRGTFGNNNFNNGNQNRNALTFRRGNYTGRPTNFNRNRGSMNNRPYRGNNKCSLCGYSNHKATDCRNIKDDAGNVKQIIPTMGTCSKCPSHVFPRLHHPEIYCTYRAAVGTVARRN
jgi:hypothetical protein